MTYSEFIQSIKESRPNVWFKYSERHHIVPRCIGGTDDEENLIYLTYQEHFRAHILLLEEYPGEEGLIRAVMLMTRHGEVDEEEYSRLKKLFSDSQIGNTHNLGHRASPEELERRSKAHRGHAVSQETREKISSAHLGKSHTEESKRKISNSLLGNTRALGMEHTQEFISAHSSRMEGNSYFLGKNHSEETKKRISESMRGKKFPSRKFHLMCKQCGNPFLGTGVRQKYCDSCREVSL